MLRTSIYVERLRMHAFHGVLSQERTVGNDYEINLKVGCPIEKAMHTDDVADTVNYATLVSVVEQEMKIPSALLEHVAGRILNMLRTRFTEITSIKLSITKIAPPIEADLKGAGVEIEWEV